MISKETRTCIKGFLEGFIQALIEQHRPDVTRDRVREARANYSSKKGELKPFHEAMIPPEVLRVSAFERSFSTKLGTTFEECGRLVALQTYPEVRRNYKPEGPMAADAAAKIEEIVSRINTGESPDFRKCISEVLAASGGERVLRPAIADLYLKDKDGNEYFFEIKSPKPNKGQCLEVTDRLLRWHAILQKDRPEVNSFFAMAYNPFGRTLEDYTHSFAVRYLDMQHEVLLGEDFWRLLGGPGTYDELLDIYAEVGREKGKGMIDALAFAM